MWLIAAEERGIIIAVCLCLNHETGAPVNFHFYFKSEPAEFFPVITSHYQNWLFLSKN